VVSRARKNAPPCFRSAPAGNDASVRLKGEGQVRAESRSSSFRFTATTPLPRDLSSVDFTSRRPYDHLRQMNDLGHLGLPQVVLVWRTLGLLICCTG
jgi:hypothetical protein